jgi:hypothetical protein
MYKSPAFAALALAVLTGCGSNRPKLPVIAEAWAGPAALKLRKEIPLESPAVATVKHGDRLDIVQHRRRFLKVRTGNGVEGWTDEGLLLSSEEMSALRDLSERSKKLPSHGIATTFDLLNVHTIPARQSPSFMQVKQGDKLQVLMHLAAPRTAPPRKPLLPPPPKKVRTPKKPKESKYQILMPAPPPPPANWLDMSRTNLPVEPPEPPKPVPMDDWTLIRTASGQAGWVLTRRLFMAIPDEVAQYAEGHRITSYFPLGEVRDGDQKKNNWLWTTSGGGAPDADFDSFRVFIWSLRRHRYETAYIERKVRGWFPVEVHNVTLTTSGRTPITTTFPGFSICTEREDGQRVRRDFAFIVNVVRYAGQGACTAPPPSPLAPPQQQPESANQVASTPEQPPAGESPSFFKRARSRVAELTGRWFTKKAPAAR